MTGTIIFVALRIVDVVGPGGILTTSGRPFTMVFTIYLPSYSEQTLDHECVHVWQFETGEGASSRHPAGEGARRPVGDLRGAVRVIPDRCGDR